VLVEGHHQLHVRGFILPTKNIEIREIANATFFALEKSCPKEERRHSNHKNASNIQKVFPRKTPNVCQNMSEKCISWAFLRLLSGKLSERTEDREIRFLSG